jgi:hypothetical protein
MAHAGQSDFAPIHADTILDFEVTGLHAQAHTKTMDQEHAVLADGGFKRSR